MEIVLIILSSVISIAWCLSPYFWYAYRKKSKLLEKQILELNNDINIQKNNILELKEDNSDNLVKIKKLNSDILSSKLTNDDNTQDLKETSAIQLEIATKATEKIANHFINDSLKFIIQKLNSNNYETSKKRLDRVLKICDKVNVIYPNEHRLPFYNKLKDEYKKAVLKEEAKFEQQKIKEQIREEQRAERAYNAEVKKLATQEKVLHDALEKALKKQNGKHTNEIELLKAQLAEAQANSERVKSQAQLTKAGHVYVISNIGSFGENVYKVGMTRRLEPMDRVKELGDASVPFPFDVHMMISSDNAPALENELHKRLHTHRLNRVNLRREFFKIELEEIISIVKDNHGEVAYKATPEALQYNESLALIESNKIEKFDELHVVSDEVEDAVLRRAS